MKKSVEKNGFPMWSICWLTDIITPTSEQQHTGHGPNALPTIRNIFDNINNLLSIIYKIFLVKFILDISVTFASYSGGKKIHVQKNIFNITYFTLFNKYIFLNNSR